MHEMNVVTLLWFDRRQNKYTEYFSKKTKQNDKKYQGSICMCEKNGKQRKNEKKKNYTDFCNSVIVPICSAIISETNKEKKEITSL